MKRFKYITVAMLLSMGIFSCTEEYKINNSATVNMSGEWWVEIFAEDDTTLLYAFEDLEGSFFTSNTSADINTEILLNLPAGPFGPFAFKLKAPINYATTSFVNTANLLNLNDSTPSITVHEGNIFKNAATAPSLHSTDSIRLVVEYVDGDPGVKYIFKGYKDTGWPEDRHD